jgi:hypothetical protein
LDHISSAALATPLLLILVGALLFVFVGTLARRRVNRPVFLAVCFAHLTIYLAAFSVEFAIGDAAMKPPILLSAFVAVLSAPLMYLLEIPPTYFGYRWWGDDSNMLIGLALLNSGTWGFVVAFFYKRITEKRLTASRLLRRHGKSVDS